MSTTEALAIRQVSRNRPNDSRDRIGPGLISGLTVIAVCIHGYHPYAEDGGIYLPNVLRLLHPDLYPTWSGFVTAQSKFSIFAPAMAALIHFTGLSASMALFVVYVGGIWATLQAGWMIASRCFRSFEARFSGVSVLALCLSMPVAGTSLILMDPYVTARTISTPCSLFAIAAMLDVIAGMKGGGRLPIGGVLLCVISLAIGGAMHPLMTAYAAGCILLLACTAVEESKLRILAWVLAAGFSITVAALLFFLSPQLPTGYEQVALTRDYWFLGNWHWYEVAGLLAPLLILLALARYRELLSQGGRRLAWMAMLAGSTGLVVSLLFVRESAQSYTVAMLQPLRVFQVVYAAFLLLAGGVLGELVLRRSFLRFSLLYAGLGALMFFVQLRTFPHSGHIEFPGTKPQNDWERGFQWIRSNTPKGALFAMDSRYILDHGEDAQNFRAVAERSSLPDYAKDGGVAAIAPYLTRQWRYGQSVQQDLNGESDAQREAKLRGAGVQWMVLSSGAQTDFSCPYRNGAMKVCEIPAQVAKSSETNGKSSPRSGGF